MSHTRIVILDSYLRNAWYKQRTLAPLGLALQRSVDRKYVDKCVIHNSKELAQ